jgi:hypothetical protein
VTYDDLIELARLCFKQAAATTNRATAAQLRRMADEYQARAAALGEATTTGIAAIPDSSPQAAPPLQQQQPQPKDGGEGELPSD